MKKTIATLALGLIASFGVVGCTAEENPAPETQTTTSTTETTEAEEETSEPETIEEVVPEPTEEIISEPEPEVVEQPVEEVAPEPVETAPEPEAETMPAEQWYSSPDNPALAEYYAEQERLANISVADGGTCPAYLCGYGTDEQGQPNPSSGELQMKALCESGSEYVTADQCAGVAWVEHPNY